MGAYFKTKQLKKRRGQYFKCETCKEEFYVTPSHIRTHKNNGTNIRFCSKKCYAIGATGTGNPFYGKTHKEDAIRKMMRHKNRQTFKSGKNNPNFIRFGAEYGYRGSHRLWWRKYLIETVKKCEHCGNTDKRVLVIHHKDRNKKHNERDNLFLLCHNCHAIIHWDTRTGNYHNRIKD